MLFRECISIPMQQSQLLLSLIYSLCRLVIDLALEARMKLLLTTSISLSTLDISLIEFCYDKVGLVTDAISDIGYAMSCLSL